MPNTTRISVFLASSELYIIASTAAGSSELCHLKYGSNTLNPVGCILQLQSILPPGNYDLTMIGISWGGPWVFEVETAPPIGGLNQQGTGTGVVWTKTVQITV